MIRFEKLELDYGLDYSVHSDEDKCSIFCITVSSIKKLDTKERKEIELKELAEYLIKACKTPYAKENERVKIVFF